MDRSGGYEPPLVPIAYQLLTIGAVAQALTIPPGAKEGEIAIEGNALSPNDAVVIRFRSDGNNPTAGIGMPLLKFSTYLVRPGALRRIRFISADGLNQFINITYYG